MNKIPCSGCVDIKRRDSREARRAVKFCVGCVGDAAGGESGSLGCGCRAVNDALGCSG